MDHDLDFDNPEALLDPFGGTGAPDPVEEAFGAVAKGKEEEADEGDEEEEEEEEEEEGDPMTAMSPPRPQKAPEQQKQQQHQPPPSSGQVRTENDNVRFLIRSAPSRL